MRLCLSLSSTSDPIPRKVPLPSEERTFLLRSRVWRAPRPRKEEPPGCSEVRKLLDRSRNWRRFWLENCKEKGLQIEKIVKMQSSFPSWEITCPFPRCFSSLRLRSSLSSDS